MQLDRRSQRVLTLVIDAYVATAQPVSSQQLVDRLRDPPRAGGQQAARRGFSAASLRAAMATLDGAGLLMQPHKSAGRVPTEAGLRLYVDSLLAPKLRPWDRSRLEAVTVGTAPEDVPTFLGQQLARLSGQAALVAVPKFLTSQVREVGLVALGQGRILAYFVGPFGHVQQKVVESERNVDAGELLAVQNLLNEMLQGRSLQQMRQALAQALERACDEHDALRAQALAMGHQLWPDPCWQVVVEGTAELLLLPEFADRLKLHEVLRAIEQKALMLTLVDEMLAHPGVVVRFGSEHAMRALPALAYVGCSTDGPAGERAAVGLFGPPRMDYGRLVPLVQHASAMLARFFAQL